MPALRGHEGRVGVGGVAARGRARLPRRFLLAASLLALSGALAASAAGASSAPAAAARSATSGCADPVVSDPYDGYRVGVPNGWEVFRVDGRLVVTPSGTAPEQSIVAPVLLTSGLTPASYFASALGALDKQIAAIGNAMSYHVTGSSGGVPTATLSGRDGQTALSGRATVLVLPDATAHGSQLAVLSAYWAPVGQLGSYQSQLASVALCYRPEPAPLFRVFKDQVFSYALPPDFAVKQEGQDSLLVADGNAASASFLLTLLPASDGVTSAQTLGQYVFSHEGIDVTDVLASSVTPQETSSDGAVNQLENIEFLGTLNGTTQVHGLASVEASVDNGVDAAGVIRLALTERDDWNSLSGAVIRIAAGVEHSFSQDIQQWERLSAQQQQFGQQVEGFDQALNGEDLVQDPSTGATFEAPYNSYQESGPDGPGYYTGSSGDLQKLQIITPS